MADEAAPRGHPVRVHKQPSAAPNIVGQRASTGKPEKKYVFCTLFIAHHMQRVAVQFPRHTISHTL
jgi:hypothetical protein